jgi:hypothetical protein
LFSRELILEAGIVREALKVIHNCKWIYGAVLDVVSLRYRIAEFCADIPC